VPDASERAQEAVSFAKDRSFEREAVTDERAIMRDALRRGMGDLTYDQIRANFDQRHGSGEFQTVNGQKHDTGRQFTTRETIAAELATVGHMQRGRNTVEPILPKEQAAAHANSRELLNPAQRKAIEEVLSSQDRVHGLQGLAGSGKTTTLSCIREGSERNGYAVEGFAPTSRATAQLREAGISADTLQGFLARGGQEQTKGDFLNDSSFRLHRSPFPAHETEIPLGLYELPRRSGESHLYRLNHPLAELVVEQSLQRDLPPVTVQFDYSGRSGKVSLLEPLLGASGWLSASRLSVEALDQAEDHLILTGMTDLGAAIDPNVLGRIIHLPATVTGPQNVAESIATALSAQTTERQTVIQRGISERNAQFFSAEADKLDGWADDLKLGLERDIKEFDRLIKEARRAATAALTLEEKLAGQKQIRTLEAQRNEKRRSLFDAQDTVDKQRDALIQKIESKLTQRVQIEPLFQIRWELN
jgi:hypothetical protein